MASLFLYIAKEGCPYCEAFTPKWEKLVEGLRKLLGGRVVNAHFFQLDSERSALARSLRTQNRKTYPLLGLLTNANAAMDDGGAKTTSKAIPLFLRFNSSLERCEKNLLEFLRLTGFFHYLSGQKFGAAAQLTAVARKQVELKRPRLAKNLTPSGCDVDVLDELAMKDKRELSRTLVPPDDI